MTTGRDTRERVLRTAAGLFQRQGYHGTGLNQIVSAGQAPKGSLYFHFPGGKEQIAVEAVAMSAEALGEQLRAALTAADPRTGLTAVVDLLAAQLTASEYLTGCPVAAVAQDAAGASQPIRSACGQAYAAWIDGIAAALRGWGVPVEQSGPLATVILSAVEGALLLARVQHDTAPLRAVADQLATFVNASIAP
ncbi:MAG TPA: TetR/AcrR family transcriptional regulator [Catenuloplanes sp.]|jgi:TetR/AcrR family transcriptional repressor of lmrAB and yxaGH operons